MYYNDVTLLIKRIRGVNMKKLILVFVSLLFLAGCSDTNKITTYEEVTTYKEVIEDNKVMIDGISYDIESVTTETITYDKKDRVLLKDISHEYFEENAKSSFQASDITTKYSYKGD
jgi:PBP1b-binding outer membrane lipoprotein LpoB